MSVLEESLGVWLPRRSDALDQEPTWMRQLSGRETEFKHRLEGVEDCLKQASEHMDTWMVGVA